MRSQQRSGGSAVLQPAGWIFVRRSSLRSASYGRQAHGRKHRATDQLSLDTFLRYRSGTAT